MAIRDICKRQVVTIFPEATAEEAARLMKQHHVGYLVVTQAAESIYRKVIGVISDRDLVRFVIANNLAPAMIHVDEIMSRNVDVARESDGLLETLRRMRINGYRRMPVVDANGHLYGVVSSDDLLRLMSEELKLLAEISQQALRQESKNTLTNLFPQVDQ